MRKAAIIVDCPARSSKGVRNEEKCMMTVVEDYASVLKGRQNIDLRCEKEIEIAGQIILPGGELEGTCISTSL